MTDAARSLLGAVAFCLLIVLPAFLYLRQRRQSELRMVLSIFVMWVVWNIVHAPLHELSHLLAGLLAGQHVKDYRLIQHFWEGDVVRAYIGWESGTRAQYRFSTPAPYILDTLMILLGFLLARWANTLRPFAGVLFLLLAFLRPLYDIATNYAADTMLGGAGDIGFLLSAYPSWIIHLAAWALMLIAVTGTILVIRSANASPAS